MQFDYTDILKLLQKHQVEFMLVGGYAVNFHGYNRNTSDMDIWVRPDNSNKPKIISTLLELKYKMDALTPVQELDFSIPFCFRLGAKPFEMDIMNYVVGAKFPDAWEHRIQYEFDEGLIVSLISYKDLLANKLISGRPKDKLDVDELIKIHRLRGDE